MPGYGALGETLAGDADVFLFLHDKLGGTRRVVTVKRDEPPAAIELYPYDRMATQIFKLMDGPATVATAAKGKWTRFDVDLGWSFWLRMVNGRPELKLAPGTHATISEVLRQLQMPGLAPISVELADAPPANTAEGRVLFWLLRNIDGILATERKFSIDRRAIAGAIAWEALQNPWPGTAGDLGVSSGLALFSGPGKVHYKEFRLQEGLPSAVEVELLGRLPRQSMETRRQILATAPGALLYIGTIMREFANIAARVGYFLDCDPPMLTTFYNAWSIAQATRFFGDGRKAPTPLTPGPDMGSWVQAKLARIETMVGPPPGGVCRKPRGY
jgi:hypothetical protein